MLSKSPPMKFALIFYTFDEVELNEIKGIATN